MTLEAEISKKKKNNNKVAIGPAESHVFCVNFLRVLGGLGSCDSPAGA